MQVLQHVSSAACMPVRPVRLQRASNPTGRTDNKPPAQNVGRGDGAHAVWRHTGRILQLKQVRTAEERQGRRGKTREQAEGQRGRACRAAGWEAGGHRRGPPCPASLTSSHCHGPQLPGAPQRHGHTSCCAVGQGAGRRRKMLRAGAQQPRSARALWCTACLRPEARAHHWLLIVPPLK